MGELSINGIYQRDDKVYSNPSEYKSDSAITIDFSNGVQPSNGTAPIYTLMGCGFTYEKPLKNPNQEFDSNGRLIKQNFGPHTVEYEYDENGVKTKEIYKQGRYCYDADCELTIITFFDKSGKATHAERTGGIGKYSKKFTAKVNESVDSKTGLPIRVFDEGNGFIIRFFYDNKDNIIRHDFGNRKFYDTYNYNDKGLCISQKSTIDGSITTYKYNANNQLVSEKWKDEVTKYKYNDDGKITQVMHYVAGKLENRLKISYDENGKESQRLYYFDDNNPYRVIKYKDGQIISDKINM